jgi:hypothetical protein
MAICRPLLTTLHSAIFARQNVPSFVGHPAQTLYDINFCHVLGAVGSSALGSIG